MDCLFGEKAGPDPEIRNYLRILFARQTRHPLSVLVTFFFIFLVKIRDVMRCFSPDPPNSGPIRKEGSGGSVSLSSFDGMIWTKGLAVQSLHRLGLGMVLQHAEGFGDVEPRPRRKRS